MRTIKLNREFYIKLFKYLLYISFILLIFNIMYLQNHRFVFWINNVSKYSPHNLNVALGINYISREQIDFKNIIISPKDINKNNSNIFFIETTCCTLNVKRLKKHNETTVNLNIRQACSIESAANLNENSKVLILYACPLTEQVLRSAPEEIIQIFRYTNVKIVAFNMSEYFKGTPVEDLVEKKILENSSYPLEHTSDVLRLLTLWKYGGTYLDLDVINIRLISELGTNFVGYEWQNDTIGSAILNFERKGLGFKLLTQMLNDLKVNFSTTEWTKNGPALITKVLLDFCKDVQVKEEHNRHICNGFSLYKEVVFYPLKWTSWRDFFDESDTENVEEQFKESYFVHLWNKLSYKDKVYVGSQQPYDLLAKQYCQLVHSHLVLNDFETF